MIHNEVTLDRKLSFWEEFVGLYQTNIISAVLLSLAVIILIPVLPDQCFMCNIHLIRCGCGWIMRCICLIPKDLGIRSHFPCAMHLLQCLVCAGEGRSISHRGKEQEKRSTFSNASVQSFIHFFLLSQLCHWQACGRCSSAESYGSLLCRAVPCDKSICFGHTRDNR